LSHAEVVHILADMLVDEWAEWDEKNDDGFLNMNDWIGKAFPKQGLCNAVNQDNKCNPLQQWTVVLDESLSSSKEEIETLSKVGVEFASPIMYVGPDPYWYTPARYYIEMFYYFITTHCGLVLV